MPKPQYIHFSEKTTQIAALVDNNNEVEVARLRKQAEAIKVDVKQPPGYAIGYFEQGLLVGGLTAVTSLAVGLVVLWKYGISAAVKLRK